MCWGEGNIFINQFSRQILSQKGDWPAHLCSWSSIASSLPPNSDHSPLPCDRLGKLKGTPGTRPHSVRRTRAEWMRTGCYTQGLEENGPGAGGTRKIKDELWKAKPNMGSVTLPLPDSVTLPAPQPHEIWNKALHQRQSTHVRASRVKGKVLNHFVEKGTLAESALHVWKGKVLIDPRHFKIHGRKEHQGKGDARSPGYVGTDGSMLQQLCICLNIHLRNTFLSK